MSSNKQSVVKFQSRRSVKVRGGLVLVSGDMMQPSLES